MEIDRGLCIVVGPYLIEKPLATFIFHILYLLIYQTPLSIAFKFSEYTFDGINFDCYSCFRAFQNIRSKGKKKALVEV